MTGRFLPALPPLHHFTGTSPALHRHLAGSGPASFGTCLAAPRQLPAAAGQTAELAAELAAPSCLPGGEYRFDCNLTPQGQFGGQELPTDAEIKKLENDLELEDWEQQEILFLVLALALMVFSVVKV